MTLVAGAFSRDPARPIDAALAQALAKGISRRAGDRVAVLHRPGAVLVKVDVGAYAAPGLLEDAAGRVSLLAGETLLAEEDASACADRASDLASLHGDWSKGRWDGLRRAKGIFSAVFYQPEPATLCLVSDRLGVRPLYYWWDERLVVFSSTLRLLEELSEVPKRMDVRGVTEISTQGFPLGRRTPYVGVERIGAGEVVRFDASGMTVETYWRWDRIPAVRRTAEELAAVLDQRFQVAVARRLRSDLTTAAFLSGGMDSRTIVAGLQRRGAKVRTFNFSLPGMQDHAFAAAFAHRSGSVHEHYQMRAVMHDAKFSVTLVEALGASPLNERHPIDRPSLAWSGDGGSVCVGHVYMTQEVVDLLRRGRLSEAVGRFLSERGAHVPTRILSRAVAEVLAAAPATGILDELRSLECEDPAQAFYLFLLLNDQRRHLTGHFEEIDLHRLELQLPFFDPDLLVAVVESPLDIRLFHRAYAQWFEIMPEAVTAVPWQTYPGHVPCLVPAPSDLEYQWDAASFAPLRSIRRRRLLGDAGRILWDPRFPSALLKRGQLGLAALAYGTGLRECDYLLSMAGIFHRYWRVCGGRYAMG